MQQSSGSGGPPPPPAPPSNQPPMPLPSMPPQQPAHPRPSSPLAEVRQKVVQPRLPRDFITGSGYIVEDVPPDGNCFYW
jgi:hypothetical protein